MRKCNFLIYLVLSLALCGDAQNYPYARPQFSGTNLTSKQRYQQLMMTTPAYRRKALKLIVEEANRVAQELNLPEQLPIVESNLVAAYIPPPQLAQRLGGGLGNVTTSNYTYYVSVGYKFSFLEQRHLEEGHDQLQTNYLWSRDRMDTNAAFQLATQWLTAASMDVKSITNDCNVHIDAFTLEGGDGKHFVPDYWVYWTSKNPEIRGTVAEVEFVEPTKTIRRLRVSKSEYIFRKPLEITNLDYLLSQTNAPAGTNTSASP